MQKEGVEAMDVKIFTDNIEEQARKQIYTLAGQEPFKDCKIRIMPDVHAGAGCVIGFTANLGDKVIPNIVGVDIGCGMLVVRLQEKDINLSDLDKYIRANIPSGMNVHERIQSFDTPMFDLRCFGQLKNIDWLLRSKGTLGGGNHFIEIDEDEEGGKYLVIHTGSRNWGKQVADYYQKLAIEKCKDGAAEKYKRERERIISEYKSYGREEEIAAALKALKANMPLGIPNDLCYLEGADRDDYLHDMEICQQFACENRDAIANSILKGLGLSVWQHFTTIHNYIEIGTGIVRKGAVRAEKHEYLIIPINMRDGCIIGVGKGNPDWNYSAPHGAGRIMSRAKARETLTLGDYRKSMEGIYTTSVCFDTIDEAPMVYKPMEEIIKNIEPTVEVRTIIKPIYNFKAAEWCVRR